MADIKLSALPTATTFGSSDSTTGLQGGVNKNFPGSVQETFINRAGGTLYNALALKAPLASPAFTGNPTAVTQAPNDNSTRLATTAYVDTAVAASGGGELGPYVEVEDDEWLQDRSFINAVANTVLTYTGSSLDAILRFKQDSVGSRTLEIDGEAIPVNTVADSVTYITRTEVDGDIDYTWETNVITVAGGDTTAPLLDTVEVEDIAPLMVKFTFDEVLDATHVPLASDFTISGHTTTGTVIVSTTFVYVPVTAPFVEGEAARTAAYTPGLTANQLRDMAGNLVVAFSGETIDNNVIMPVLASAAVETATPSQIDLVFSKNMNSTWSAAAAFAVSGGHSVSSVTRTGATTGYLTLGTPVVSGEVITVDYTEPVSNKMKDTPGGNLLASFTGEAIDNNISGSSFPYSQDFESTTVGALPSGWTSDGPLVSSGSAIDGTKQLEINSGTPLTQPAIYGTAAPLSCVVVAKFKAVGGLPEMGIYQRADTATASAVDDAFVMRLDLATPGIQLYKKISGSFSLVTSVSTNLTFSAGIIYLLTYSLNGSHLHVASLQRMSDNLYYDPATGWVSGAANFLSTTDTSITAAGFAGVYGALTNGATNIYMDTFSIT